MIKQLFLFRHGQTDWNAQGKIQGHEDIALNTAGIEQAHALGQQLKQLQIELIASSDLRRASQTADIVATYSTTSIIYTPDLREIHYGTLQGDTWGNVIQTPLWGQFHSLGKAYHDVSAPGGETKAQATHRAIEHITSLLVATPYARIGICSHGFIIRLVVHALTGHDVGGMSNAGYVAMTYDAGTQEWSVTSI